ncbi:MAG: hypothetical protein JJU28_18435 [Cyclobacteriaceae bacterium]|nr:hypothetical protein [Cyclobacteriaceae bacterium]
MKNFISLLFLSIFYCLPIISFAQFNIEGAWRLDKEGKKLFSHGEMVKIYKDGYFMFGWNENNGDFIAAGGGYYHLDGNTYTETYDFYTLDSTLVQQPVEYAFKQIAGNFSITGKRGGKKVNETWKKIEGSQNELSAAWRFSTRVDADGNIGERRAPGPRQTIKVLSGNRFQWAAFNFETRQFMGTGGGSYRIKNGEYTEVIHFFSRDNSRVGASLNFNYKIDGNDWFQKGLSSTGNPIHEVWEKIRP